MNLPPYTQFPVLSNESVVLRSVTNADLKYLMAISYYDGKQATSIEEAALMQAQIDKDYLNGESIHWVITDKRTHKVVGTCGYYRGFNGDAGELGCILIPEFYGMGYMFNAMPLAINFGLTEIGLVKVWASTGFDNTNAIKLLGKLGFLKIDDASDGYINYEYQLVDN